MQHRTDLTEIESGVLESTVLSRLNCLNGLFKLHGSATLKDLASKYFKYNGIIVN